MNRTELVLWSILGIVSVILIKPIILIGIFLFMFFHELGHALVASYYGAFKGFGIHGMALTTKIDGDLVPKNRINTTLVSGMLFNILTMSIVMPLFRNQNLSRVLGSLALAIILLFIAFSPR